MQHTPQSLGYIDKSEKYLPVKIQKTEVRKGVKTSR